MNLTDIPLLDVLRQRMSWLSARQNMLSQNVANADTPGYTSRDLKPQDFASMLNSGTPSTVFNGELAVTDPRHIAVTPATPSGYADQTAQDGQGSPGGNTVSVEEEMMKVADTQAQYEAAANMYSKAIGMMHTAIGTPIS